MISRRSFLQTAAAATVGFALPLSAHVITSEPEVGMEGWKFGVWEILHQYSEECDPATRDVNDYFGFNVRNVMKKRQCAWKDYWRRIRKRVND